MRLHVSAKRFLCAVDPSYHASLSPASRHSLVLQGGPFDERAAAAYIKAPYAQDGLTLRRLDDLAKDPAMRTPNCRTSSRCWNACCGLIRIAHICARQVNLFGMDGPFGARRRSTEDLYVEGNTMPKESLLRELSALREQLEQQPPLNEEQRAELELLIRDIELKLANEDALNEGSLVDGVNLAVEHFEVSHPTLAGTLRSIVQSLANMGI